MDRTVGTRDRPFQEGCLSPRVLKEKRREDNYQTLKGGAKERLSRTRSSWSPRPALQGRVEGGRAWPGLERQQSTDHGFQGEAVRQGRGNLRKEGSSGEVDDWKFWVSLTVK